MYTPIPSTSPIGEGDSTVRTFGMLSTFPPTACGIATFAAALSAGLVAHGATVDVVRCGTSSGLEDPLVLQHLGDGSPARVAACIEVLNATDVVIVQHEYGIYDGIDGESVLEPDGGHRRADRADRAHRRERTHPHTAIGARTGMRDGGRRRRHDRHRLPATAGRIRRRRRQGDRHSPRCRDATGVHSARSRPTHRRGAGHRPRLLTWGLLGPGKGIEWAIDAFAELADLDPAPTYVIAGATHPKVREHAGEAYREMLVDRAERSGSGPSVSFDDSYRDLEALTDLIRSADLVVLPYDSADQVTSGVLVDAVAAGRPVVSTAFPHAVELLASGAGIVVPQRDPAALAAAIRTVLTDTDRADAMAAEARRLAPELSWAAVAATVRRARRPLVDRAAGRGTGAGVNVIPLAPLMPATAGADADRLASRADDDRRGRDLRARRLRRTATRSRLLHR